MEDLAAPLQEDHLLPAGTFARCAEQMSAHATMLVRLLGNMEKSQAAAAPKLSRLSGGFQTLCLV